MLDQHAFQAVPLVADVALLYLLGMASQRFAPGWRIAATAVAGTAGVLVAGIGLLIFDQKISASFFAWQMFFDLLIGVPLLGLYRVQRPLYRVVLFTMVVVQGTLLALIAVADTFVTGHIG